MGSHEITPEGAASSEEPASVDSARRGRVVEADRVYVLGQLRDLKEWALYIHDSLHADRPIEKGKRRMLEAYMGQEFLRDAERECLGLAEQLERIARTIESSALPAERAGVLTR